MKVRRPGPGPNPTPTTNPTSTESETAEMSAPAPDHSARIPISRTPIITTTTPANPHSSALSRWLSKVQPGDWLKLILLVASVYGSWVRFSDRLDNVEHRLSSIDSTLQRLDQRSIEERREFTGQLNERLDREREVTNREIDSVRSDVVSRTMIGTPEYGDGPSGTRYRPRTGRNPRPDP